MPNRKRLQIVSMCSCLKSSEVHYYIVFLYNLLGLILVDQEKFDQAIDYYEKGIGVDPNFAIPGSKYR